MTRNRVIGAALVVLVAVLGVGQHLLEKEAIAQAKRQGQAPKFEVDPVLAQADAEQLGLRTDDRPRHRRKGSGLDHPSRNDPGNLDRTELAFPPPAAGRGGARGAAPVTEQPELNANQPMKVAECCFPAPPVVAFDPAGNVVHSWGGPKVHPDWPDSNHGIIVDNKGNVWIGGNGQPDSHILKFTRDGKFVAMFGKKGARRDPSNPNQYVRGADDLESFGRVAKVFIDGPANEAYVADGYGNKRVAVIDMDTGKIKRYWGGYGEQAGRRQPDAVQPEGRAVAAVPHAGALRRGVERRLRVRLRSPERSHPGLHQRRQVRQGKAVFPETLADGSVWDIAFSKDPQQKFIYVADGKNEHIYVIDRQSLELLTSFGDGGRQPGLFFAVHSIAVDSKGNIYTTETYTGKRLQKFVYKGMVPLDKKVQGAPWPTRTSTQ